jgi:hypothetical protein
MARFAFEFSPLSAPLRLFGIAPRTSWVEVDDGYLDVECGPWWVRTPVTNILDAQVTGPYNPLTTLGIRVSATDRGLTFGTTADSGVCLTFDRPIGGVLPIPFLSHPGLTVTVRNPAALRDAVLTERDAARARTAPPRKTKTPVSTGRFGSS